VAKLILVASPHLAFQELLRLSLEESGKFRVRLARSSSEALNLAGKTAFASLILDADLTDAPFATFTREIRQLQPQARLLLIPPENNPKHPSLQGLPADAYINKPFYQPDLIKTVEAVLALPNAPATPEEARITPPPPADHERSTSWQRLLDQTVVDGTVQAALIQGGGQMQTSDGRLSPAALKELAETLSRTRGDLRDGDQFRFVKLQQGNELLLFSTSLGDLSGLALACDSSMPLSRVRAKAARLVREINGVAAATVENNQVPPSSAIQPAGQPGVNVNEDDLRFDDSELEAPDIRVQELLTRRPLPPLPSSQPPEIPGDANGWLPEAVGATVQMSPGSPLDQTTPNARVRFPVDPPPSTDAPTIPIFHRQVASDDPTQPVRLQKTESSQNRMESNNQPPPILPLDNPAAVIAPDELEMQSFLTPAQSSPLEIETISMTFSRLSYSALMLPRFPQHALVGKLSGELAGWLPQLCVAFGWRLEGLAIRPDRLQFTFQAPPSISPGNVVRILRQKTSQRIFSRFPELKDLNPSGDFWAPGYLIISGSTPPPPNLLNDFVAQTRRRQGLAGA
jgi:CheY-like chemotaxis protein/REP element-mobilizing transposase RayT